MRDAVGGGGLDQIIIPTLPKRTSKWLRRDLIRQVEAPGLLGTAIVPDRRGALARNEIARAFDLGRFSGGG